MNKALAAFLFAIFLPASAHATPLLKVVIFPFIGEAEEGVGEALAEALAYGLGMRKGIKVVRPGAFLEVLGEEGLLKRGLEERIRIGQALHAQAAIDGAFRWEDRDLLLHVRFLKLGSGDVVGSWEGRGPVEKLFALEEELGRAFLQAFGLPSPQGKRWLHAFKRPTASLPAYIAYAEGRRDLALRTDKGYEKAIGAFQRALELDEDFTLARYGLGLAFAGLGYHWRAVWEFMKATQIDPGFVEAYKGLGDVLASSPRKFKPAIDAYAKALELDPEYVEAYVGLGDVKVAMEKIDEAMAVYQKALRIDPDNPKLHYSLGKLYANEKDLYGEAVAAYQKAISLDPDFIEAHLALGELYEEKGLYREAVLRYEQAISIDRMHPGAYYALARALERLDRERAIMAWERYIQLASELPSERDWMDIAKRHLKKLKEGR